MSAPASTATKPKSAARLAEEAAAAAAHEVDGNEVLVCERCPALCKSRKAILNGHYNGGATSATIMFIADRPGQYDNDNRRAFSGLDAVLWARMLENAGIPNEETFVTYSVRCWPQGNRKPKAIETRNCADHLAADIAAVKPRVIVTLGAGGYNALFKGTFTSVIGLTLDYNGIPVVPTYSPAYLFGGHWGLVGLAEAHLSKAWRIARGQQATQPLEEVRKQWLPLTTLDQVRTVAEYLLSDEISCITIDSETTGVDWMKDEILCVSLSGLNKEMRAIEMGFTVPLLHRGDISADTSEMVLQPFWDSSDSLDEVVAVLGGLLRSDKPKGIQNSSFDIRFFERSPRLECVSAATAFGWKVRNLRYDPMLLQRLLDENFPANETVLTSLYTDVPYYEADVKALSQNKRRMDLAPDDVMWTYAAGDADVLARLIEVMVRRARHQGVLWLHDNISIPMVRATVNMTFRGIDVDMEYFDRLCRRYKEIVTEAEQNVMQAYGRGVFNLNKPADLQRVLFHELGLPQSGRKTKSSKTCEECLAEDETCDKHDVTGRDALLDIQAILRNQNKEPHPILEAILEWKRLSKQKSVYVDGKLGDKGMLQFIGADNKVHPEFKVNRADTGRLAATKPPIQTIPKKVADEKLGEKDVLRRPFIAPPGMTLMEMDWSQGEVWVMAYESGDETLLALLKDGQDVHSYVARELCKMGISRVFPLSAARPELSDYEWKNEYDELRRKAKVFVFGLDYGMTEVGAAERLGCAPEEAGVLIGVFLSRIFPSLEGHFARVRKQMERTGQTHDRFGRIGHFADYELLMACGGKRGKQDWEGLFRKGLNMGIQAGLNDLHQLVQVSLENDPVIRKVFRINNAVHDSVMGLTLGEPNERDRQLQVAWMIKERAESMARNIVLPSGEPLGWEIPVELQWGKSWGNFEYTLTASGEVKEPKSEN
jgi:uracil-DNA glycosylase family 4